MKGYIKDPDAIVDYQFDWSPWLQTDRISTSTWSISPSGSLTVVAASETIISQLQTRCFVEGGDVGEEYTLTNRVETIGSRTDDRSIKIRIQNR